MIALRSLFTLLGDTYKDTNKDDVMLLYHQDFPIVYALMFNEHTHCDNIYLQENNTQGEQNDD